MYVFSGWQRLGNLRRIFICNSKNFIAVYLLKRLRISLSCCIESMVDKVRQKLSSIALQLVLMLGEY
jgi:hypothetical protein